MFAPFVVQTPAKVDCKAASVQAVTQLTVLDTVDVTPVQ